VRVVRQIAPNGQTRVLMANLTAAQAPAHCSGALYHQRWRIEEAFKRLKHRLQLESISGPSQHALLIDVAAKILADNLASLLARATHESVQAAGPDRPCNLAYAQTVLQSIVPRLLVFAAEIVTLVRAARGTGRHRAHHQKPQAAAIGATKISLDQASSEGGLQGVNRKVRSIAPRSGHTQAEGSGQSSSGSIPFWAT
jgi:hypothetical protein